MIKRLCLFFILFFFQNLYLNAKNPDPDFFLQFKIKEYYLNVNPKPDSLTYINCDYIQKKLSLSEIFIDFFETGINSEITYWLIIIKKDIKPFVIRFPIEDSRDSNKIESVVNTPGYRGLITEAQRTENNDKFYLLVRDYLQNVNTIFYSVSRSFWLTNIKFFVNHKGEFLFQKYRMIRLNSAASFLGNKHRLFLPPDFNILLIGGLDYTCGISEDQMIIDKWKYLSGSKTEIDDIKKTLGKNHPVYYLDSCKVTEKSLFKLLSDSVFQIIHFATHGFYLGNTDDRSKLDLNKYNFQLSESGIVLSGANNKNATISPFNQDGLLTALELKSYNLSHSLLVVLSICHSGKGENQLTTVPLGLPLAFLRQGVRAIIVSNRAIPDDHSKTFMSTLYNFINLNFDLDDSFNFTLKKLNNEYPAVDWSFFDLIH